MQTATAYSLDRQPAADVFNIEVAPDGVEIAASMTREHVVVVAHLMRATRGGTRPMHVTMRAMFDELAALLGMSAAVAAFFDLEEVGALTTEVAQ